jgi:hypothetical protein
MRCGLSLGTGSVEKVSFSSTRIAAQSRFQVAPAFSPRFPTPQTYKVYETLRRVRLTTQRNPAGHQLHATNAIPQHFLATHLGPGGFSVLRPSYKRSPHD